MIYRIKRAGYGGAWGDDGHPLDCYSLEQAIAIVFNRFAYENTEGDARLTMERERDGKLSFYVLSGITGQFQHVDSGMWHYEPGRNDDLWKRDLTQVYEVSEYIKKYSGKTFMRGRAPNSVDGR